ncbi:hypothetical protein EJB05_58075, partial [Eragrostis curvula]
PPVVLWDDETYTATTSIDRWSLDAPAQRDAVGDRQQARLDAVVGRHRGVEPEQDVPHGAVELGAPRRVAGHRHGPAPQRVVVGHHPADAHQPQHALVVRRVALLVRVHLVPLPVAVDAHHLAVVGER